MRDTFERLNSDLNLTLIAINLLVMFTILSNIYQLTIIRSVEQFDFLAKILIYSTTVVVLQLVFSCIICGSVHKKSDKISDVLDRIKTCLLSDSQYRDWLSFKNICHNKSFGFTIGGFAALKKTTLIAVSNQLSSNQIYFKPNFITDLHIRTQLHCNSYPNQLIN